jgi:predicted exporter
MNFITNIYDKLTKRTKLLWTSFVGLTILFVVLILNLNYSEDITDFLPLGTSEQESLSVYQSISGADRMYMLFNNPDDADQTINAIEYFISCVHEQDTLNWCHDLTAQYDISMMQEVTDFIYQNIPYFLTAEDYERMELLLGEEGYIRNQLEKDKEMLMFPSGGIMTSSITKDPLGMFNPVLAHLQDSNPQIGFEMYEGYIFTPDMSRAVAMMSSPFGNSETEYNSQMLKILHSSAKMMNEQYPEITVNIVGGPEIAVGNASRIKKDSITAILLSVVLIAMLVVYSIGSLRNILLIFLSISWGWLFALAGMSLFSSQVSIIVIGISSVILGIAVNYPLHMIVHLSHTPDVRTTLKELFLPLLIGNVTTVGAFMTLLPLQSVALRDLGLFASLLLVGTILFVIFYLPHMLKVKELQKKSPLFIDKIASFSPERHKIIVAVIILCTLVLGFYSFRTEFDSNIANINYMTESQRRDMQYFQNLLSRDSSSTTSQVYVMSPASSFDEALQLNSAVVNVIDSLVDAGHVKNYKGVSRFLVSKDEQQVRLNMWEDFVAKHKITLTTDFIDAAKNAGFSPRAFVQFQNLINEQNEFIPQEIEYFEPLTKLILSQNLARVESTGKSYVINTLNVDSSEIEYVKSHFDNSFDVVGMNSALSNNLSDNFSYIGWACSLIVFLFLWFSFGRIELAIISFIPMAVSWIWILGIMAIVGIKFNIVNIILATFIFGQGDDYTIFMTEGCQHEYTYRKPILASYKSSILQSALIMLVGIGTLIISKHPAMRSLAEVTIVGMLSVVMMSYTLPPLLFKWLTMKDGSYRIHPITIKTIFTGVPKDPVELVRGRYLYKGTTITNIVRRNLVAYSKDIANLNIKDTLEYTFTDSGYGECAILLALLNPDIKIKAYIDDQDKRDIAKISAKEFVNNIEFI